MTDFNEMLETELSKLPLGEMLKNPSIRSQLSKENIERLEFLDILVQLLRNYTSFMNSLSGMPEMAEHVDEVAILRFLRKKLAEFKELKMPCGEAC